MKQWLEEMADYFRSISQTDPYYVDRAQRYRDAARYYNPNPNHGSTNVYRGRPGERTTAQWRDRHVNHV